MPRAQAQRRLPQIAVAVEGRLTVVADAGVRSGLDVVRMLAMGAKAVWLGRLWAYALAAGGEPAVSAMLAALKREIQVTMGLAGCRDLSRPTPEMLCELSAERSAAV